MTADYNWVGPLQQFPDNELGETIMLQELKAWKLALYPTLSPSSALAVAIATWEDQVTTAFNAFVQADSTVEEKATWVEFRKHLLPSYWPVEMRSVSDAQIETIYDALSSFSAVGTAAKKLRWNDWKEQIRIKLDFCEMVE